MELELEVSDRDTFIPPDAMSYCLRFLCYHYLGDISNKQKSLRDFRKGLRLGRSHTTSNAVTLLGVCHEISGDKSLPYQCYDQALQGNIPISHTAEARQSQLFNI